MQRTKRAAQVRPRQKATKHLIRHAAAEPANDRRCFRPKFDDTPAVYRTSSADTAWRLLAPAKRTYAIISASSSGVYFRPLGGCFQVLLAVVDATSAGVALC